MRHISLFIALTGLTFVYLYWKIHTKNVLLEERLYFLEHHVQQLTNPIVQSNKPIELEYDSDSDADSEIQKIYEADNEEPQAVEEQIDTIREITEEETPAEDIVITKLSHCTHILQSGKNKGTSCGKPTLNNGFCKSHTPPIPLSD